MSKTTEKTSLLRININWCIKKIIEQEIKKWLYRLIHKKNNWTMFFFEWVQADNIFWRKKYFSTHPHSHTHSNHSHPPTDALHPHAHPPIHTRTHPPTHPLTHSLTHLFIHTADKKFPRGRGRRAYQRGEKKMLKWGALESKWFEGRRGLLFIRLRWWVGGRGEHPLFPPSPHIPSERVYFSG